uniref:Uncharacterized protein n=1 Tax=Trichuris muris TaxID=70415 RepID=A0A5S6QE26_TRIMR
MPIEPLWSNRLAIRRTLMPALRPVWSAWSTPIYEQLYHSWPVSMNGKINRNSEQICIIKFTLVYHDWLCLIDLANVSGVATQALFVGPNGKVGIVKKCTIKIATLADAKVQWLTNDFFLPVCLVYVRAGFYMEVNLCADIAVDSDKKVFIRSGH